MVFFSISLPSISDSLSKTVEENRESTIYLRVEKANEVTGAVTEQHGTGFVINQNGYVITAAHVVREDPGFQVKVKGAVGSREGTLESMEILALDSNFDVALLRFKNTFLQRRAVSFGDPWSVEEDATIYAMGFPGIEEWFHTEGKLSGKVGPLGSWNTTIILNPNMSGGPIFNIEGNVIALVWGGVPTPGIVGINRVLPINLYTNLLHIAGVNVKSLSPLPINNKPDQNQSLTKDAVSLPIKVSSNLKIDSASEDSPFSEINLKAILHNKIGTSSEDKRVDEHALRSILGPGPKTGCHGETLDSTITILDVTEKLINNSYLIGRITYSGNYSRQSWITPCIKSPYVNGREDLKIAGDAVVKITHQLSKPPSVNFIEFQNLGEKTDPNHDANIMARRALETAVREAFYNMRSH